MFEDLLGLVLGPVGIASVALFAVYRACEGKNPLRTVAKTAVRAGLTVMEKGTALIDQVQEETSNLISEVKAEQEHHEKQDAPEHKKKVAAKHAAE